MRGIIITILFSVLLFISCKNEKVQSGIDLANFDKSYSPQQDFYRYVNGTWLKKTKIPADKSNYGSFTALYDEAQQRLRKIIEDAANKDNPPGSDEQKIGDFYKSFMDTAHIEALGLKSLKPSIDRVNAVNKKDDLPELIAWLQSIGVQMPFSFYVAQDGKHSDRYICYISQSGLGMPDRDYYLNNSEKFKKFRGRYKEYIIKLLTLGGEKNAANKADRIIALEKEIAQYHWTRVENRDRDKTYNNYEVSRLIKDYPHFNWEKFISNIQKEAVENIIVRQPGYLKGFDTIMKKASLDDWKNYFEFKLISAYTDVLPDDYVKADFDFYGKTLSGIEQIRPRWKRGVSMVDGNLGEVLGRIYVGLYFKPQAKERMKKLVDNLVLSYRERLRKLDWMSNATKKEALLKLSKFNAKIGYPDKWKDYSSLEIKADDLLGNYMRSNIWDHTYNMNKLGKPVDRGEWGMTPQTVNAYYSSTMNEVVFPAAILQPPFFNMEADDAVNYGAIGSVIGHELTHGFDDQGRKSDGDGNLRNWWTDEDRKKFDERAQRMVEQYDLYSPIDTLHINGRLTLGENIADLGGVTIAYYAYQNSLNGKKAPVIDKFSGNQRFFIGWAQIWRRKYKDDELRKRLLTDPHSPSEYRVNGILSNMPEFYKAFNVHEQDKMFRPEAKRVQIW
jgi:predicted metalloendopeptidase